MYDYTGLRASDVAVATDEAITEAEQLVTSIIAESGARTHANTMAPLDEAGVIIADAHGRYGFMGRVHPDQDVRDAALEAEERLTKWTSDLAFREDLYAAVSAYAATEEAGTLEGLEKRSLDFALRDFRRSGQALDPEKRADLQALRQRLIELQVAFQRNVNEWKDFIEVTEDELDGMTAQYISRLAEGDTRGTRRVSLDYPEYLPFMEEARRRDLRHALQHKFYNVAADENSPILEEAVAIRRQMADLLGHATWADYAMEIKMADPDAVAEFYASIVPGLTEKGRTELAVLQDLMAADHPDDMVQAWDWTYYDSEQRKRDYGVDPNVVASYFPLEAVLGGLFAITGDVLGLDYRRIPDPDAWHEDVALYEIRDRRRNEAVAYFYADLFPRDGKYGHAACFGLRGGRALPDGSYRKPVAAIVANVTKPGPDQPSLLKHSEAVTLFHEFGHVLHYCLTEVAHPRFAGFETEWDFVEAPSQIMENWMWEPEVLARFARHHETGEPIPADLVGQLVAARDQNIGLKMLRQVFFGKFDLALHAATGPVDVDAAYRQAFAYTLLPFPESTRFAASFGHIMGGYDAGYYGYLWAKVFGDDMFSAFAAGGVLNPTIGKRYREEILAAGASRDANEHLEAFLGRSPSAAAFMARLGLEDREDQ
jgi:Zn-dependent oligopeptidase